VHQKSIRRVSGKPRLSRVTRLWQVTPPKLALNIPSYEIVGANYRLRGNITDDTKVSDVYIIVSNRDANIENKKVFYRSNSKSSTQSRMEIDAQIPLWPGSNAVTVVARENSEVQTARTLYLFRSDGKDRTVARESN